MVYCEVGYRPHRSLPPSIVPLGIQSKHLAGRGFNPAEALLLNDIISQKVKRAYLRRNLETTVNHVFEDSVVSFTNYYQLNAKGEIVTYPDNVVLHVDSDERGGLYNFGLRSAIGGALQNPNQLILLYSPPGPVVFDSNPNNKFREIKPYAIGQLYVMYSDGTKVHNVAVGISQQGESWLSQIMPDEYHDAKSQGDKIRTIKHFITHPTLLNVDINTFLNHNWIDPNQVVYRNKDNVDFPLAQVLELIRKSLSHNLPRPQIVDKLMQKVDIQHVTPRQIEAIYETLAQEYMADRGLERMKLGGSCGGKEVSLDS
ncbi:MAG: hypothetical protein Q8N98_01950, partial [bacterium]|nr:hypothetical protein [bacterium]